MLVLGQWKMGGDNPPIFKLVQIGAREVIVEDVIRRYVTVTFLEMMLSLNLMT